DCVYKPTEDIDSLADDVNSGLAQPRFFSPVLRLCVLHVLPYIQADPFNQLSFWITPPQKISSLAPDRFDFDVLPLFRFQEFRRSFEDVGVERACQSFIAGDRKSTRLNSSHG